MRSIVAVAILLLVASSCEKSTPTESDTSLLYGSWQWLETRGGYSGEAETPQSTGYTKTTVFLPGGIARFYRNDTLVKEMSYSVYSKKDPSTSTEVEFIQFNVDVANVIDKPIEYIDKTIDYKGTDTLRLSDTWADAYSYLYARNRGQIPFDFISGSTTKRSVPDVHR